MTRLEHQQKRREERERRRRVPTKTRRRGGLGKDQRRLTREREKRMQVETRRRKDKRDIWPYVCEERRTKRFQGDEHGNGLRDSFPLTMIDGQVKADNHLDQIWSNCEIYFDIPLKKKNKAEILEYDYSNFFD